MSTIGIDIGGSKALTVRIDEGVVADERKSATQRRPLIDIALEAAGGVWADDVEAVGVGLAGLVQWPEGVLAWGPHVQGTNIPLKAHLERELGVPVAVDNDANVAALGEHVFGAAQGFDDFLLVTLGTGIGGAIMINGSVYRGESFAGEWGHIRHNSTGLLCDCGKRVTGNLDKNKNSSGLSLKLFERQKGSHASTRSSLTVISTSRLPFSPRMYRE